MRYGIVRSKPRVGGAIPRSQSMLHYAVVFFVIAVIAALLGFSGIATGAAGIAKILFVIFLIGAVVAFFLSITRRA